MAPRVRDIDDDSAEQLLEGDGAVPTGYERVAELFGRLREPQPVEPDDLVVTRMQAAVDQALTTDAQGAGRWRRLVVVGAIAGAAVVAVGGLGAAGALPDVVQRPVSDVLGTLGIDAPSPGATDDDAPTDGADETPDSRPRATPAVPGTGDTATIPAIPADPPAAGGTPSQTAPGQTGNTPGATAPGETGNTPGATAPGQTGITPGATAPGRSGTPD